MELTTLAWNTSLKIKPPVYYKIIRTYDFTGRTELSSNPSTYERVIWNPTKITYNIIFTDDRRKQLFPEKSSYRDSYSFENGIKGILNELALSTEIYKNDPEDFSEVCYDDIKELSRVILNIDGSVARALENGVYVSVENLKSFEKGDKESFLGVYKLNNLDKNLKTTLLELSVEDDK